MMAIKDESGMSNVDTQGIKTRLKLIKDFYTKSPSDYVEEEKAVAKASKNLRQNMREIDAENTDEIIWGRR